ncbi:hypothetical protein NZD89_04065 [Alicyclobacillus fastidiosus]|uniref:Uncharacterized protein n=1 Tax=Alicyclobacillus fastidiosus TaxID=392011 RepID=A0ABY6ZIE3_9BACL|nr:hypothetical protein [Alicyclobacillus fastidiosus]WAH42627.1 hypothetical protein NZD89_04065 [Alicyclobacillus fastidiosus]
MKKTSVLLLTSFAIVAAVLVVVGVIQPDGTPPTPLQPLMAASLFHLF